MMPEINRDALPCFAVGFLSAAATSTTIERVLFTRCRKAAVAKRFRFAHRQRGACGQCRG